MLRHQGNDKLIGSNRVDIMHGRAGDDILKGFGGEDNGLLGEKGNDELRGGSDRDALSGGPGKDMLNGGEGNDLYYYLEPGWGHDRITDTAIVDNDFRFGNALSFEFVPNIGDLTINLSAALVYYWCTKGREPAPTSSWVRVSPAKYDFF